MAENRSFVLWIRRSDNRPFLFFEDYFTDGLFENSNLTTNIEFFSFERLAVGPVGYMSKRRESVLLKDSSFTGIVIKPALSVWQGEGTVPT